MNAARHKTKLAVSPKQYTFNANKDTNAERKFKRLLVRHDKATEVQRITAESEVLLDSDGKINGKTLTTTAMSQLCSSLAPGLSLTVQSIVGLKQTKSVTTFDDAMAIRLINNMIRLRFDGVSGMHAVIDHSEKQICGFVGRKYEFLSNLELYNRVKSFVVKLRESKTTFREASVYGRRIMLRFITDSPLFDVPIVNRKKGEPYYGGFHFSNSEVGECSIRAAAVLLRQWSDTKAISPFMEGGKVVHLKGSKFDKKFADLLKTVRSKAQLAVTLKHNITVLMTKRMGLGGDSKAHKQARKNLETKLVRRGLYSDLATTVVDRMLARGSYRNDMLSAEDDRMEAYAGRTEYDLFNAITNAAKKCTIGTREKAEQIAYQLVLKTKL
jgi:hypothetical protein